MATENQLLGESLVILRRCVLWRSERRGLMGVGPREWKIGIEDSAGPLLKSKEIEKLGQELVGDRDKERAIFGRQEK